MFEQESLGWIHLRVLEHKGSVRDGGVGDRMARGEDANSAGAVWNDSDNYALMRFGVLRVGMRTRQRCGEEAMYQGLRGSHAAIGDDPMGFRRSEQADEAVTWDCPQRLPHVGEPLGKVPVLPKGRTVNPRPDFAGQALRR